MINRIANWLRDYAVKANIQCLVVGVSGGIDSAVVERLSELTGLPVIAVAMPMYMHGDSDPKSLMKAMELCVGRPNVQFHVRPIGEIVAAYKAAGIGMSELNEGNLRSRIRANILYDFAGAHGGLVVGTGNEDEDEIGYFTKGGDGLVDICPLSKTHKSVVRAMATELDVPHSIADKNLNPPTAGLWDGQTDEGELGMTYDEVEWAIEHDKHNRTGLLTERQETVLAKVRAMRKKNGHKLCYPPVFDPDEAADAFEGAGEAA